MDMSFLPLFTATYCPPYNDLFALKLQSSGHQAASYLDIITLKEMHIAYLVEV